MKDRNCPNCGAALDMDSCKCPYCGTLYYDLSVVPTGEMFLMKVKDGGRIITVKAYLRSISVEAEINAPLTVAIDIQGLLLDWRNEP